MKRTFVLFAIERLLFVPLKLPRIECRYIFPLFSVVPFPLCALQLRCSSTANRSTPIPRQNLMFAQLFYSQLIDSLKLIFTTCMNVPSIKHRNLQFAVKPNYNAAVWHKQVRQLTVELLRTQPRSTLHSCDHAYIRLTVRVPLLNTCHVEYVLYAHDFRPGPGVCRPPCGKRIFRPNATRYARTPIKSRIRLNKMFLGGRYGCVRTLAVGL